MGESRSLFFSSFFEEVQSRRIDAPELTFDFSLSLSLSTFFSDKHKLNGFREAMNAHLGGKGLDLS